MTETELHSHPRLREQRHEALLERLKQIQQRRLVTAIEHKIVHEAKMRKVSEKLFEQWSKQDDRNAADLIKAVELLEKIERGIAKQIEIAHKLQLAEI